MSCIHSNCGLKRQPSSSYMYMQLRIRQHRAPHHGIRRRCKIPPKHWAKGAPIRTCPFSGRRVPDSWAHQMVLLLCVVLLGISTGAFPYHLPSPLPPSTHSCKVGILFWISTSVNSNACVLQHRAKPHSCISSSAWPSWQAVWCQQRGFLVRDWALLCTWASMGNPDGLTPGTGP